MLQLFVSLHVATSGDDERWCYLSFFMDVVVLKNAEIESCPSGVKDPGVSGVRGGFIEV